MSRVSSKERYVIEVYELFRKKGLRMTMDEIADHLKLTQKTLYNNFNSKDELMRTVMQHVLGEIEFKINMALSQGRDAIEALYHTSDMMNKSLSEIGPLLLVTPLFISRILSCWIIQTECHFTQGSLQKISKGVSLKVSTEQILIKSL